MRAPGLCLLIALVSAGAVWGQGFQARPLPGEPSDSELRQTPAATAPAFRAGGPVDDPEPPEADGSGEPASPRPRSSGSLMGQALPPAPSVPAFDARAAQAGSREPDELLVVSPDLTRAAEAQDTGAQVGLVVTRRSVLQGLGLVVTVYRLPQGMTPEEALEALRARGPHLRADLNHRYVLQSDDARAGTAERLMGWPRARGDCGRGVRIGVLDGPLPDHHPALGGAHLTRHSVLPRGMAVPAPDHALAVAAILVGREQGLVPGAALFHAEVMRLRGGRHADTTVDRLVQGLDWLALEPVDLVNLSLGGPRNLVLEAALGRLMGRGIAVIAAAGNQGPDAPPIHPAAQDGVIAVTAVDADGRPYRNAARGDHVAFAAPGVDLRVPRMDGDAYVSGTSFAAPHVTAALAAGLQSHPDSDWLWHLAALAGAAQDLGQPGRDPVFGWGLARLYTDCGGG